jgi:hypothetical protein
MPRFPICHEDVVLTVRRDTAGRPDGPFVLTGLEPGTGVPMPLRVVVPRAGALRGRGIIFSLAKVLPSRRSRRARCGT